jgi:tetratricopeptide (TPR) repeat protein
LAPILAFAISVGCDDTPDTADQLRSAVHLLLDGRAEDALVLCDRILAANPSHSEAYLLRGEVFEALGNERKAIDSYFQALRVNPESEQAAASLAKFNSLPAIQNTDFDQTLTSNAALGPLLIAPDTNLLESAEEESAEKNPSPWDQLADRSPLFIDETAPEQTPANDVQSVATSHTVDSEPNQRVINSQTSPLLSGLQQAIEEGRRLDQLAKERESQQGEDANAAADSVQTQGRVIRFDLGLDIVNRNNGVSGTRTTGQPITSTRSGVFSFSPGVRIPQSPPSSGVNHSVFGRTRRC